MNETRYNAYLKASETLSPTYCTWYKQGLEHHMATLKATDGAEPVYMGPPDNKECLEAYSTGRAGKPPKGFHYNIGNKHNSIVTNDTNMNIRLPSKSKADYMKQAEAAGMTLTAWVTSHLDRIVRREKRKAAKAAASDS